VLISALSLEEICIVGAPDRSASTALDLTYFSGSRVKMDKTFWDNQDGTNRNRCIQILVILYVQTY